MKHYLLSLFLCCSFLVQSQNYQFLGSYTSDGTPLYLEPENDVISVATQDLISNALPESFPVPDYNPHYISAGYDTSITLGDTAEVFVTFVSEGAGYKNVLGFYTFDASNPSTVAPQIEDITIIFPNVSALGSGGGLEMGNKVNIGSFPAGTGIGWVMLANGWQGNAVTNGYWTLFSNPDFNPENDPVLRHHNVLLTDLDNDRILLGFEDIRRDYSSCDNDFNDAIFYVTANPFTSIVTSNYATVSSATENVSSSNNGGLESDGNLANLIAKRNFRRTKNAASLDQKKFQKKLLKEDGMLQKKMSATVQNYLPVTGMYGDEDAYVSSPTDLLGITNALEIFSMDLYKNERRVSAVLATKTEGSIYDHSKAICDRLNNGRLEDVRTVVVRGHQLISSKIMNAEGNEENTLSFSISLGETSNELFSFWNIDQYPSGDYYNFQIWGSSFSQVFSIANHIIDSFKKEKPLVSTIKDDVVPQVFVRSGYYSKGIVYLDLVNRNKLNALYFEANITETERSGTSQMSESLVLNGERNQLLEVHTGGLFDIGFTISKDKSSQKDALYLADGPWGLDYLEAEVLVNSFEVERDPLSGDDFLYELERQPSVVAEVKGTMNLFRHVLPGNQTLDITSYDAIQFDIKNSQTVELILVPNDLSDWNERLRVQIPANSETTHYVIPFHKFLNDKGESTPFSDIKTIVYSMQGDFKEFVAVHMSLSRVAFGIETEMLRLEDENVLTMHNFPNPFENSTSIKLLNATEFIDIDVINVTGVLVDSQRIATKGNKKVANYQSNQLTSGLYFYIVQDDENREYKGRFFVY